jgi:osmotically-inducible protein OsmY
MRLSGILVKSFVSAVAGVVLCFSSLAVSFAQEKDISDDEITIAVTRALVADQGIDANWVDVITQEGIVTLDGVVDDLLTRQRADKVAATVKGVRGVVNNITVEPVVKSDMRIEQDIENALAWNSATELWEVNVSSRNGAVTLTGKVDSWQERELAGIMARNITGVKEITNNITVEFDRTRSDHEIEQDVLKNLRWDRFVDASMVDVSVNDGIVSLSGTVGSAAEKNRVETLSWVSGVSSVRNDAVDVESWARDEEFRKDKFVQKSDTQVRQAVIDALRMDPRVNPDQVDVRADVGTGNRR